MKIIASLTLPGMLLLFNLLGCSPDSPKVESQTAPTEAQQIAKGEYLVGIMGCNDCHSPKVFGPNGPSPDPNLLLSGHPASMPVAGIDSTLVGPWVFFNPHNTVAVGPWGASFAANLTSDATGIGNWTLDQFKTALKKGKYKGLEGARNLLPPMPWPNYKNISDEDVAAIFAYLKSTKPVSNVVPAPKSLQDLQQITN